MAAEAAAAAAAAASAKGTNDSRRTVARTPVRRMRPTPNRGCSSALTLSVGRVRGAISRRDHSSGNDGGQCLSCFSWSSAFLGSKSRACSSLCAPFKTHSCEELCCERAGAAKRARADGALADRGTDPHKEGEERLQACGRAGGRGRDRGASEAVQLDGINRGEGEISASLAEADRDRPLNHHYTRCAPLPLPLNPPGYTRPGPPPQSFPSPPRFLRVARQAMRATQVSNSYGYCKRPRHWGTVNRARAPSRPSVCRDSGGRGGSIARVKSATCQCSACLPACLTACVSRLRLSVSSSPAWREP